MDTPQGSVEFEETDELQSLRRRAYGPDADIAGDAAAQTRLSELEDAQRRQLTLVVDAAVRVPAPVPERDPSPDGAPVADRAPVPERGPVREPVEGSVTDQDPAEGPIADSHPIDEAPAAPWWRRRRWLAILGLSAAAFALIAAVAAWRSQADESSPILADMSPAMMLPVPDAPMPPDYAPPPHYVLAVTSVGEDADAPNDKHGTLDLLGISTDELRRYQDYPGHRAPATDGTLNVWSGKSRDGRTCLFVAFPVQGLREGYSAQGCTPEGLDTIVDLRWLGGDGLTQFVLKGDHVNVYVYERAPDPSASPG